MIAKAQGFMLVCIGLTLLATGLLIGHYINEGTWSSTVTWVWSAQVLGGLGKVTADRWAESRNGANGSGATSGSH